MKHMVGFVIGGILLTAAVGRATPPGQGQHFDCTDGGDTSCAADDTGCVSNGKAHLACSTKTNSAFGKAVLAAVKCHIEQAEKRFKGASENGAGNSEENCEENPATRRRASSTTRLANLADAGICDPAQVSGAATEEGELFGSGPTSLDGRNGTFFCDSSSAALIGDDDTGWVPATADIFKCEVVVAKITAKLSALVRKCHKRNGQGLLQGRRLRRGDVRADGAREVQQGARQADRRRGLPPCLDGAAIDGIAADAIAQRDSTNDRMFPCNLGP